MKKEVDRANRYLVHNVRNSLVHLKLIQRRLYMLSRDIEKTLNIYRETIEDLVNGDGTEISDGKNSEDEHI